MALIKALDFLNKQGKLTFDDPTVRCELKRLDINKTDTKSESENKNGSLKRRKRADNHGYSIPAVDWFKEGYLITRAMKEISFRGVSGRNISFSKWGGPAKNTYMIVNVRTGNFELIIY